MNRRRRLIIIGGALLLLAFTVVGVVLVVPMIASASSSQNTTANVTPTAQPTQSPTTTAQSKTSVYQQFLKKYRPSINAEIAQALHLTPDQLQAQLKAGKSISDVATAQHVSAADLHTITTTAFQDALKQAVTAGDLTQQQADQITKKMQKSSTFFDHFLNAKHTGKKNTGIPAPTVTPTP